MSFPKCFDGVDKNDVKDDFEGETAGFVSFVSVRHSSRSS
ncbi:hypothetical protein ZOD2009_01560 [Haladaptatus paucihalophilus DX253]|uniref:Uncharacterized protein n=1 Tax=Haladaptatus paucihalophilus DX253 TaxID=797209 RepID=E7QMZ4_HALPU|nr:hypothetical protein ZOD2009_01560 [Haladaptatus paucihalophilus DX253]